MKQSIDYTLYGDLDGMTVAQLRELLDDYPDEAYISVQKEPVYVYGGWSDQWREYFVFKWSEES